MFVIEVSMGSSQATKLVSLPTLGFSTYNPHYEPSRDEPKVGKGVEEEQRHLIFCQYVRACNYPRYT